MKPSVFRRMLNFYGPYFGAGIKVEEIAQDWRYMRVSLKLTWYNRNAMNTQFGGSLYSMTDPHYVLLLMKILGRDYTIWDKSAEIDFLKPGKGKVSAEFVITDEMIADIKRNTESGEKYLPTYCIEVKDQDGNTICKVKKTLYIKKKFNPQARF